MAHFLLHPMDEKWDFAKKSELFQCSPLEGVLFFRNPYVFIMILFWYYRKTFLHFEKYPTPTYPFDGLFSLLIKYELIRPLQIAREENKREHQCVRVELYNVYWVSIKKCFY